MDVKGEAVGPRTARVRRLIIAIDGPAGAGKSTLAARLAGKLSYVNIETGAMYRALALKAILREVPYDDEGAILDLANESRIELIATRDGNRVTLDTEDVSERIRDAEVTEAASHISVHPRVREWMVARQRQMGLAGGVVMEGRDIGTQVFPDADVKIFLDADPEVRGQRRFEQQPQGASETIDAVLADLHQRDHRDRTRTTSPLVAAPDAVHLDASHLTLDEVVARAEEIIEQAREKAAARPK